MSIRNKLLLSFTLTSVLILAFVGTLVFKSFSRHALESFSETASGQLERIDDIISVHLGSAAKAVDYIAKEPLFQNGMALFEDYSITTSSTWVARETVNYKSQQAFDIFEYLNKTNPLFVSIYVGYADSGHAVFPPMNMPAGYSPPKRGWYQDAETAKTDLSFTQPYTSSDGSMVVSVMSKIKNPHGLFVGVASVDFALTGLTASLDALRVGKTGFAVVIDGAGTVLVNPMSKGDIGKNINALKAPLYTRIASVTKAGEFFEGEQQNETYLVRTQQSPDTGWTLAVMQKKSDVLEKPNQILLGIALAGIGVLLVVIIVAFYISRSIATPISRLVQASSEISKGNFNSMPEKRFFSGELASLWISLSSMTENLQKLIDEARNQTATAEAQSKQVSEALKNAKEAEQRAADARQEGMLQAASLLKKVMSTVTSYVSEINSKLDETSSGITTQLAFVSTTATSMEEMSMSISEVSRSAENASKDAREAKEQTENGVRNMNDVVLCVKDVIAQATSTRSSLENLGEQAGAIGRVMTVISDIADQTNLLALNAAIEAARAGDAGRGFAVVADEVRKLAENTMRATNEVNSSIKGVQETTQESISRMQAAETSIERTITQVAEAENSLTGIQNAIDSTTGKIVSIATAARQQTVTSEEVARGTIQTSEMLEEYTENIGACGDLVNELSKAVRTLNDIIVDLQR